MSHDVTYRYLNLERRWPLFRFSGLEARADGSLTLAPAPSFERLPSDAPGCDRYVADPEHHRILRINGCDGSSEPLTCARPPGAELGQLDTPHGVALGPHSILYVADIGNKRIVLIDANTGQWRGVWTAPGLFLAPWDVAVDRAGAVYVADAGQQAADGTWSNGKLLKFAPDGVLDAAFTALLATQPRRPTAPVRVAVVLRIPGDLTSERVLVLDRPPEVLVYTIKGVFEAALPAAGTQAYATCGTCLAGPYATANVPPRWQRLEFELDRLPHGTHVRWFTLTSDMADGTSPGTTPPLPLGCGPSVPQPIIDAADSAPAPLDRWRAVPPDVSKALILNAPGRYFWLAGMFEGDGTTSPRLHQIRLEHDLDGWLQFLPAIYRRDEASRVFLDRGLALFEEVLDQEEDLLAALPRFLDPYGAPDTRAAPWLEWLAAWEAADLDENWASKKRSDVVAAAFEWAGRRGTPAGIRRAVALHTGAEPIITELGREAPWVLGGEFGLGLGTYLAPAAAGGATLGSTAVVDHARLITPDDVGAPLFEDVAHRFVVEVYAAHLRGPDAAARIRRVIDREKPAHTVYDLCVIRAAMRVGAQARVGIDTIVAGAPNEPMLDGKRLGDDTIVAEDTSRRRGGTVVGERAFLGKTTSVI
jgi:phage tail-like protein